MALSGLALYRSSRIDSSEILYFLDASQAATLSGADGTASATGGTFNMMLLLNDSNNFVNGGSFEEINDVTQKLAISAPSFGSSTLDIDQVFLKEDPICQKLLELYKTKPVGSGAEFVIARVDTFDTNKLYYATCSIVVSEFGGSAQDSAHIVATVGLSSDWLEAGKAAVIDPTTGILTEAV